MTATLSYFTVTQAAITDVESTTTGTNPLPTVTAGVGTVTFTPNPRVIESPTGLVTLAAITAQFTADGLGLETQGGAVGVKLVDNVGLGLAPNELTYRVDYLIPNQWVEPYRIIAPGTGEGVDLDDTSTHLPADI